MRSPSPAICGVSAPIFDHAGALVLALSSLGHQGQIDTGPDSALVKALCATAAGAFNPSPTGPVVPAKSTVRRRPRFVIVATSLGIGLALAWGVTRLLASQLYGVEPRDPAVWGLAVVAMSAAGLAAAVAPAWQASRTAPMSVMRAD